MEITRENLMALLLTLLIIFIGIWILYRTITSTFNESGCKFSGDRYIYANNTKPNKCPSPPGGGANSGGGAPAKPS